MSIRVCGLALLMVCTAVDGRTEDRERSLTGFVAFRVDASRAIAVVKVLDDATVRRTEQGLSPAPVAGFGFSHFDATPALRAHVSAALLSARWVLHVTPTERLDATVEQVVGGNPGCLEAAGVLLSIAPAQRRQFTAATSRYFVAEAHDPPRLDGDAPGTAVRALASSLSDAEKHSLESVLAGALKREWPPIRDETRVELERMSASTVDYHRTWADERRRLEAELTKGNARLSFDVQAFHLDPRGTPLYFVRAQWLVGARQAFAMGVWLRGRSFDIVEVDATAGSWLRMFEFQGKVDREQLGVVLNVLDRDRDGWGEIIFARGGYESLEIVVREFSPDGFGPAAISYGYGC